MASVATGQQKLNNKAFCPYGFLQRTLINNDTTVWRERMLTQ